MDCGIIACERPLACADESATTESCLVFDPGGVCPHIDYCISFPDTDPLMSQFMHSVMNPCHSLPSARLSTRERSCWRLLPPDTLIQHDSLLSVDPGFICHLYHEWSVRFIDYPVPIATDLLTRYPPTSVTRAPTIETGYTPLPLPDGIRSLVDQAIELATFLHTSPVDSERAYAFFAEAYKVVDTDYSIQDAVDAGEGFQMPIDGMNRDVHHLVRYGGNLVNMAKEVQCSQAHLRLSVDRINLSLDRGSLHGGTPRRLLSPSLPVDFIRLARLAHHGIKLPSYDGFVPSSASPTPRKIRSLYKQVHQCVNRSIVDLYRDHLILLLPTVCILRLMLFHQTPIGWTTKEGKREGRTLFDAKDSRGPSPLNPSDKQKYTDNLRREWGSIEHADLQQICKMILDFEARMTGQWGNSFSLRDVVLFKVDLSRAFHLLSFDADSIPLLTSELYQTEWPEFSDELERLLAELGIGITPDSTRSWSMVYITGSFGLILLPFVFGVVTRCLLHLLLKAIHGRLVSYVDDSMGVTLLEYLQHDVCAICEVIELLLGPNAVEYKKWFFGRTIVMIGWKVDLDRRCISLSPKNLMKVAYGFTTTNLAGPVKVRWILKLASWSSRYTQVLRALHPCTVSLFAMVGGMNNMEANIGWTADAKLAVLIWRASLVLLHLYEREYSLPLDYFRAHDVTYEIEYDASLTGIGYLLFRLDAGRRADLVGCGSVRFPFHCESKSDYQNTCEFIAVLVGVLNLAQLGIRDTSIRLCGDSTTSLSWGLEGHFRGKLCQRAALIYILATTLFNIVVTEAVHIPGTSNVTCDLLSRHKTTAEQLGIDYRIITDLTSSTALHALLELSDPTSTSLLDDESTFRTFWRRTHSLLLQLSHDHNLLPAPPLPPSTN